MTFEVKTHEIVEHLESARERYIRGEFLNAIREYEGLLEITPEKNVFETVKRLESRDLIKVLAFIGFSYHQRGRFKEAKEVLDATKKLDQQNPWTTLYLAYVYRRLGDISKTKKALSKLDKLTLKERDGSAMISLKVLKNNLLGRLYLDERKFSEALGSFQLSMVLREDSSLSENMKSTILSNVAYAYILLALNEDQPLLFKDATELIKTGLLNDPKNIPLRINSGLVKEALEDKIEANKDYKEAGERILATQEELFSIGLCEYGLTACARLGKSDTKRLLLPKIRDTKILTEDDIKKIMDYWTSIIFPSQILSLSS